MKNFTIGVNAQGAVESFDHALAKDAFKDYQMLWIHLDTKEKSTKRWLTHEAGLPQLSITALMDPRVRPRFAKMGEGHLLILRSTSTVAPDDAEQLVSLRMWIGERLLITVGRKNISAVSDVRERVLAASDTPTPADLILDLSKELMLPIGDLVQELLEDMDRYEDQTLAQGPNPSLESITEMSRQAIHLRRHLGPMQTCLLGMIDEAPGWMNAQHLERLRERVQKARLYLEDVDLLKERANIVRSDLESCLATEMNRRLYIFSVAAVVFLPLSFVTGLFGVNVGGIPGADEPLAFLMFCGTLTILTLGLLAMLRHWRWV